MLITIDTMNKMHDVQFSILRELVRVMNLLHIKYYFVHGSLLGAIQKNDFIEEDDDIDIAIFRDDYNKLIHEGNRYISKDYFIQASINDNFPLGFAKVRAVNTIFAQPILEKYKCCNGIYIDIFPIDFYKENVFGLFKINQLLLNARICLDFNQTKSIKRKILESIALLVYPSYEKAVKKREHEYTVLPKSKYVSIYSGKRLENKMPIDWFGAGRVVDFHGMKVNCPDKSEMYLSRIYGDQYFEYNPAEKLISNNMIEVSASLISFADGSIIEN